jgi:type IX secretion system substrate protein
MRISLLPLVMLLVIPAISFAQNARVKEFKAPLSGTVVLRDVDDKYNANVYNLQEPDVFGSRDAQLLREIKNQQKDKYPIRQSSRSAKKTTSVSAPIIGINYVADSLSGIPPDNSSAVSVGQKSVNVMNSYISVHDALTGKFVTRKDLAAFSFPVGLVTANDVRYDPKVVYDPGADRYICVMLSGENQYNNIVVGFTKTNDPTGTWNFYKFHGDYKGDTTWFDYPAISITQNELFLTGNQIKYDSSWQAGFSRSVIYQFRKQDGYTGSPALSFQIWDSINYNNQYIRCLYPLNPGDALLGPSQYLLSNRDFAALNDTVFLIEVPDTIGSGNTNLTVTPIVSSLSYGVPPDAREPDTSLALATNDNRVLGGFIEGSEIQFVCTSVNPLNGASAVYLGKISNFNSSPVCVGQMFSMDTLDFGYPNISYTGNVGGANQSIVSFDYSGPYTYPGFGAVAFDGTDFSDLVNIKSGIVSIYKLPAKEQRWGDYSGSQPDWSGHGVVWVEGIYGRKDVQSDASYGNYMAQLKMPWQVDVPKEQTPASVQNLYPNPASEFVKYEFTVDHEQAFSFLLYDAQGRVVDKLLDRYCHEGQNVIQFNIAPLAPGTYFLRAVGDKGEHIMVRTFVRR